MLIVSRTIDPFTALLLDISDEFHLEFDDERLKFREKTNPGETCAEIVDGRLESHRLVGAQAVQNVIGVSVRPL